MKLKLKGEKKILTMANEDWIFQNEGNVVTGVLRGNIF